MIRAGWKVVAADGGEAGEVDEIAGDDTEDIFDGLAIATTSFGKPRYVPAEQVAGITQGVVRLSLTRTEVAQLGEYLEPATSAEIEPTPRVVLARRWLPTHASSKRRCSRQPSAMSNR